MKFFITLLACLISSALFTQLFPQSNFSKTEEIKVYKASIDSLHNLYDSLRHVLTDESEAQLKELKLGESIGEGEFNEQTKKGSESVGGFEVYTFFRNDSVCRIWFAGGRKDAYVTKHYYFQNNHLVFAEMTVRQWKDQTNKPYKVEEYYSGKNIVAKKIDNSFPKIVDESLIPISLFQDGMKYLHLELKN